MTTDAPARTKRPERPQAILTVTATEAVTPNLIRITAGGEGFDAIRDNDATDKYVKIIFADPRHGLTPPYDLAELREHSPERLPRNRTYTVREMDRENRQLTIDFVVHGDEGIAGPWARTAAPGDTLVAIGGRRRLPTRPGRSLAPAHRRPHGDPRGEFRARGDGRCGDRSHHRECPPRRGPSAARSSRRDDGDLGR